MRVTVLRSSVRAALAVCLAGAARRPCAAESGPCHLLVISRPPDAAVYIDGKERGWTPLSLMGLAMGAHEVRVVLEGHQPWTKRVSLRPGAKTVTAELKREGAARPEAPRAGRRAGAVSPRAGGGSDARGEEAPRPEPRAAPGERASGDKKDDGENEEKVPRTIEVPCPGCKGSGLITQTRCHVCGADGFVGFIICTGCQTTGMKKYVCPTCRGQGSVVARGKEIACRACRGKGAPPCPACRGTGKITRPNRAAASYPTVACLSCEGDGYEKHGKCKRCAGTGKKKVEEGGYYRITSCRFCDGRGTAPPICTLCRGRGGSSPSGPRRIYFPCMKCCGTGHLFAPCRTCRGRGWRRAN